MSPSVVLLADLADLAAITVSKRDMLCLLSRT